MAHQEKGPDAGECAGPSKAAAQQTLDGIRFKRDRSLAQGPIRPWTDGRKLEAYLLTVEAAEAEIRREMNAEITAELYAEQWAAAEIAAEITDQLMTEKRS